MIEKYKPLSYKNNELMTKKFRTTRLGTPAFVGIAIIVTMAFTIHPGWFGLLVPAAIYLLFATMHVDIDTDLGVRREFMILRRKKVAVFLPSNIKDIIEDRQALKDDDLKSKLMEYLDLLRDGGQRSYAVESYLEQLHEVASANLKLELENGSTGIIDQDLLRSKLEVFRAKKEILESN